jgi:hypothetical protein
MKSCLGIGVLPYSILTVIMGIGGLPCHGGCDLIAENDHPLPMADDF